MLAPDRMLVNEIMTRAVCTIPVGASLREAAAELMAHHVSSLPVVDEEDRPIGVLSLHDIVRALGPLPPSHAADAPTVYSGALAPHEVRALLSDLRIDDIEGGVQTCMTPAVISCSADTSVREAARIMASRSVHRVFVVDDEQRLLGVVSSMDVVGYVARDAA